MPMVAVAKALRQISGGLAPDLRYWAETPEDDAWFLSRVLSGAHQNGVTKMSKFESLFSQEAIWPIHSYIDLCLNND